MALAKRYGVIDQAGSLCISILVSIWCRYIKGVCYVPMTDEAAACFRRIIKNRKNPRKEPMIDGYIGFLYLDKNDMPVVALHWEKYMGHVLAKA